MTREEAIAIIRNEYLCVDKDCDIEKSCRKCPYAMPAKEPILEAYNMAIKALRQEPTKEEQALLQKWRDNRGISIEDFEGAMNALQEPSGDAISRQAVLDELNKWEWQELYLPIHFKENIIDVVPSVNPQDPKTVLDDIKAEIEQMNNIDYVEPVTVDEVLQIIDKYRKGEDKE